MSSGRKSFYGEIAQEIAEQVRSGLYKPGDRLLSHSKLCEKYNVSYVTASRIQNELVNLGCAYKVKGKGMFATSKSERKDSLIDKGASSKTERIVCYNVNSNEPRPHWHVTKIFQGIQRRAFELGINIRGEFFNAKHNESPTINDNEGIIIISSGSQDYLMPLFANPRAKLVFIDNIFPKAYCVLSDNYSGIVQLLDFLESRNQKKLILATKHFGCLGLANMSERTGVFENECKRRGLDYQILKSGNYNELIEVSKRTHPDAVLFTSDKPAIEFKNILKLSKFKNPPLVTGFDDWIEGKGSTETEGLTTIRVDFEQMGATAVDVVVENKLEDWCVPEIVRVPCELMMRD